LTSIYTSALQAALEAAGQQNYPPGALYVVATPIGNLADITLRALHVLQLADTVACEDTRHTQALLRAYGIDKSPAQLLAVHQHNEAQAADTVIDRLRQGQRVAYASDAGTPAISDPGARLVASVASQHLRVVPLPGASSVTAALSVAGITDEAAQHGAFVFAGFLPSKSGERTTAVTALAGEPRSVVMLEAPHRIEALAQALAVLGTRRVTIGRELTKQFEDVATVEASHFPAWLAADANRCRGEFVVVLHPVVVANESTSEQRILKLLLAELPLKTAVKLTADITGGSRNELYEAALALKKADAQAA
jgi:16S rRNA (cytidine1402-2'-O)-methyltransferase